MSHTAKEKSYKARTMQAMFSWIGEPGNKSGESVLEVLKKDGYAEEHGEGAPYVEDVVAYAHAYTELRAMKKRVEEMERTLSRRLFIEAQLEEHGVAHYNAWSRDCDCYESSYTGTFESYQEWLEIEDSFFESLEGPGRIHPISLEDYEAIVMDPPRDRDRALEAFENGHPHSV